MKHIHRGHQVRMRCLNVKQRKKQVYQKERKNAENTEAVIARRKKIRGKILGDVIIKLTVIASTVIERNLFAHKRQRKNKKQNKHEDNQFPVLLKKPFNTLYRQYR